MRLTDLFAERRQTVHLSLPGEELPALGEEASEPPRGCAWYDSSLDLARGLEVTLPEDDALEAWLLAYTRSATFSSLASRSASQATNSLLGMGRPNR